jgi:hypothetical protein
MTNSPGPLPVAWTMIEDEFFIGIDDVLSAVVNLKQRGQVLETGRRVHEPTLDSMTDILLDLRNDLYAAHIAELDEAVEGVLESLGGE